MQAQTFWKVVTMDRENFLERLITLLDEQAIRYCVIGGQAVNAYVEPLVSLDLDLVVAAEQFDQVETLLAENFNVKRFPHSLSRSNFYSICIVYPPQSPRNRGEVSPPPRAGELEGVNLDLLSLNVSMAGSDLRVQIQTDSRYAAFPERASPGQVLGISFPVASVEDVLTGKIWAAQDPTRRASKRQEDLADIARLIEVYPKLRDRVPADILAKLV